MSQGTKAAIPYLEKLRKADAFAGKTDLEIELLLMVTPGVKKLTGSEPADHCLRAMSIAFPTRLMNPWRERLVRGFWRCKKEKRKEYMVLGASNSTKTSTIADLLLILWWACPEATSIYLASPYEEATETGLWARVLEQFQEAKDANPELPGKVKPSENKIILFEQNPLSFIRVVSIDQVGKLVGKKAKTFSVGMMLIAADELPEFKRNGEALVKVMNNLISVPNMMLIGAGNFAQPSDGLGKFCTPDMAGGYAALKVERDFEWYSTRGGLVYRFDGEQSPNVLGGDDSLFPFLPTLNYREQLAKQSGGFKSPEFFRYWHSFPLLIAEEFTVTNMAKLKAGKTFEEFKWTQAPLVIGSHCDPGFGGDAAVIQDWRMGWAMKEGGSNIQVFEAWGEPITIPIDVTLDKTPEDQIVEYHRQHAERKGVPVENCSFDGSMRSSIVQAYGNWSRKVVAIDYGGPATDRPSSSAAEAGKKEPPKWNEKVANFVSELWFTAASLIQSGQLKGLNTESKAAEQLCKRRWRWTAGNKKQIEPKAPRSLEDKQGRWGYKTHSGGQSPNEADALVGGIEVARRRGLKLDGLVLNLGGSSKLLLEMRREQEERRRWEALMNNKPVLPSGVLHGTNRNTTGGAGKLNRRNNG